MLSGNFTCRYWREFPKVAAVPVLVLNNSGCDNERDVQQHMKPISGFGKQHHHQDSMHYFADVPNGTEGREENAQNVSLAVTLVDIISAADFRTIRFTLIFLDVLLVIYRLTHTAITVRSLCVGLERKVELMAEQCSKTYQIIGFQQGGAQPNRSTGEMLLPKQNQDTQTHLEYQIKPLGGHKANGSAGWSSPEPEVPPPEDSWCSMRSLLWRPLQAKFITWIVFSSVVCLGAYISLALGRTIFSQNVTIQASAFLPSVSSLLYQYHSTNEFIASAARSYGQSLTSWCKTFTDHDLAQLHNLVQFFNKGAPHDLLFLCKQEPSISSDQSKNRV